MSGVFGGGGVVNESARISTLRIQTSCYGVAISVVLGEQRCTGNMLFYGDLQAIKHKESQGGGKGGGGVTNISYGYRYSLQVGVCEGPATVGEVWMLQGADKIALSEAPQYGHAIYGGGTPNDYSTVLESRHPDQFFRYPGLVNFTAIDLGEFTGDSAPGFSFEVRGFGYDESIQGADPADALRRIVTDTRWGASAPAASFPLATAYGDYAVAMGWALGLEISEQKQAAEWVQAVLDQTNSAAVWAADHLSIIPYGDKPVSANGRTWTPDVTPIYDLTDDDFLGDQADPIRVSRKADSESWNIQPVEYRNRANSYNVEVIEGSDPASVAMYGPKKNQDTLLAHGLCSADAAGRLAEVVVRRKSRTRNTYEFTLPWTFCLLLPMDIVTITDPALGLDRYPVRLARVVESEDLEIQCEAEDYPAGAGHAALIARQSAYGWIKNFNAVPGACNPPIIFDAPAGLLESANRELWIGTSGGSMWGGADIWLSSDDVTYSKFGTTEFAVRQGVLENTLIAVADPDDTSTVNVNLTESASVLRGGTATEAALFATLCYVGGEFIAFKDAALIGTNRYALSHLRRGIFSTEIAQHNAGDQLARIDKDAFVRIPYAAGQMPDTLYIKLASFNIYGGHTQDLASISPVTFQLGAAGAIRYDAWLPTPISPTVYATPDLSGHITKARVSVSFPPDTRADVSGLLLFLASFPYENSMTIEAGGTGTTLGVANTQVLASGTVTVLAGSTTSHIVVTTSGAPLDVTVNHGGRWWACLPGGEWRKVVGMDTLGYLFDTPHDVTPTAGMLMQYAEIAWADSRKGDAKMAILIDGTNYEIFEWSELDQNGLGTTFQLIGCKRGMEGTTPINADGKKIYYFPAPGPGTKLIRFPSECFSFDGESYTGSADVDFDIPAGYFAMCSAAVFAAKPAGDYARSAIVPVSYGGPL